VDKLIIRFTAVYAIPRTGMDSRSPKLPAMYGPGEWIPAWKGGKNKFINAVAWVGGEWKSLYPGATFHSLE
jgi:hypothetical protein